MDITFRIMTREDLPELIELTDLCFNETTSLEYAEGAYDKKTTDQIYVVGVKDDKIVAHALVNIITTIYEPMNIYAILNHVCVHPDYRRQNYGTKLLDYCFEVAKSRGCKTVELWSKNFRTAAHGLYHKYGFNVVDAAFFGKEVA